MKQDSYSDIEQKIPFHHYQIQIDSYNEIVHTVSLWIGHKFIMNFD